MAAALLAGPLAPAQAAPPRADWGIPVVKDVPRPWLGISITEVEGEGEGGSAGPGLTLAKVAAGGPAASAGLVAGDVLLAVDGSVLGSAQDLKAALGGRKPGDALELTVLRSKRVLAVSLRLGTAPSDARPERRVQPLPAVAVAPETTATPAASASTRQAPTVVVTTPRPAAPDSAGAGSPPASVALTYVGDMMRPSLGVDTMDLEPGLARYFGAPEGEGVLIESVASGSPAALAGARAGDVLLRLGGKPVGSGAGLSQELRGRGAGERVALTLLREGRKLDVTTVLQPASVPEWRLDTPAAAPAAAAAAAAASDRPEALSALVQHNAREIARLEVLLAAREDGDEELEAWLERSGGPDGHRADPKALRDRLRELRREMETLQPRLREGTAKR